MTFSGPARPEPEVQSPARPDTTPARYVPRYRSPFSRPLFLDEVRRTSRCRSSSSVLVEREGNEPLGVYLGPRVGAAGWGQIFSGFLQQIFFSVDGSIPRVDRVAGSTKSKFRQKNRRNQNFFQISPNFAKMGWQNNYFKISPEPSKFHHFSNFGENFASPATLRVDSSNFFKLFLLPCKHSEERKIALRARCVRSSWILLHQPLRLRWPADEGKSQRNELGWDKM